MSQKVSSRRRASDGMLSLCVTWESVARQPIILIISEVTLPPEITSNATLELQKLKHRFQFAETMEEDGQTDKESREIQQKVDEGNTHLAQVERELEVVENELRKVIERRRNLMDCREIRAQERVRIHERQTVIKKRQEDIFKRQLYTQQEWIESYHIDYDRDDYESGAMDFQTLLIWAAEPGHEVMVRQILTRENVETNFYSRKLLSWAAENGHETTVRILLETGADIESKDSKSNTPLSWAARKGHKATVQLLLKNGADIEGEHSNPEDPRYRAT
jgi:hypothetical protein